MNRVLAAWCLICGTALTAASADTRDPRHLVVVSGIAAESMLFPSIPRADSHLDALEDTLRRLLEIEDDPEHGGSAR